MEPNDEIVERQKLVETEEEPITAPQSAPKSAPTPSSPAAVPKINIKSVSSTGSRNSASCSIERTITSDKGQTAAKVMYVNERRPRLPGSSSDRGDERFEIKSRPRKLLKDIELVNGDESATDSADTAAHVQSKSHNNNNYNDTPQAPQRPKLTASSALHTAAPHSDKFDERPIKHHSFVSEVPDVKYMERALLGLLEDFHSGKLKAFGSGCTMDQMTKIREQQESLAKLHFELASLEHGNDDLNAAKAQESSMLQLVQRLEQLSISIEQLQTSHTAL